MGAIAPQRRISKTRKRQRRSHFKLDNPSMMTCPNCGEIKLAHIVCSSCGYYDGKKVIEVKVKNEEKEVQETVALKKNSRKAKQLAKIAEKEAKAAKVAAKKEKALQEAKAAKKAKKAKKDAAED